MTRILCKFSLGLAVVGLIDVPSAEAAVVGLWRFNEASGNPVDSSGNGNTGMFVGPNASRVAGKPGFGSAAEFLGVVDPDDIASTSYVEVDPHYSLQVGLNPGNPWTFSAWAYEYSDGFGFLDSEYGTILHYRRTLSDNFPYPTPDYGLTLQSGSPGDPQYYLWKGRPDEETNPFRVGTGVDAELNVDSWNHLAMVYDGSDVIFYVNANEEFRTTVGAADAVYPGYSGALQIGSAPGFTATRNFNGMLDDVAVFNEALSATEVATIMSGDFSAFIDPLPPPAVAEWQLNTFGMWNESSSWQPFVTPNSNATTALFAGATSNATTVVNEQSVTVNGLQFDHTQPYAIAGTGSITIDSGGVGNGTISVLNAGGAVTHEIQLPVQLSSNTDVNVAANTTLEFDHKLELNGHTMNVSGSGRLNINNEDATGTTGTLNNSGTLGGSGKITGNLANTAGGTLVADILGSGPLGVQGLTVTGNATLDGNLLIDLAIGFMPTNGSMFTVLTASSIIDSGLVLAGDSSNFSYSIVGGTSLVLTYGTVTLTGDYNNDGTVDAADYVVWRKTDGTPSGYTAWRGNFGATSGAGAAKSLNQVPEPMSWLLAVVACAIATLARSRSARRTAPALVPVAAMPRSRAVRLWSTILAATVLVTFTDAASATVLIFSGEYGGAGASPGAYTPWGNGFTIIDEYGDRVNSLVQSNVASNDFGGTDWYNLFYAEEGEGFTPNVVVGYPASTTGAGPPSIYRYWSPYGSFTDAAYPSDDETTGGEFYMTFTADAGVNVTLNALQLSRNTTSMSESVTVRVHQGNDPLSLGTQLYTSGSTSVSAGGTQTFSPNVSGSALTLVYSFAGNSVDEIWDWAIDNVKFSQIGGGVPTTATWNRTGSGIWSAPTNWSPDVSPLFIPDGNDRTAILGNSTAGPSTVVLDQDMTLKTLRFNHTSAYSLAGTGELTLDSNSGNATIEVLNTGSPVTHQITAKVNLSDNTTASIASGTTLEINNQLNLGAFDLTKSGTGTLRVNNRITSTGGEVVGAAGLISGSGSIAADLVNDGAIVAPGNSPGILTVVGDYTQSAAGGLLIEIAGNARGSEYDVLAVGGDVTLDGGSLEVVLRNGFTPKPGDVFDVLDFVTFSGDFGSVSLPPGITWDVSRIGIDGTLGVVSIPEPSTIVASCIAAVALLGTSRRRSRAKIV